MTRIPPLSVVLPVHNGQPFVEQSIRSILDQTFSDFELLIADDGSTDGSTEVIDCLAREDRRIRSVRRARKSGLAASANWAVGESRADLVAIAHTDDVSLPIRLERQIAVLRAEADAVLVAGLSVGMDERGRPVQPADASRLLRKSPFAPFAHSSIMFRRSAFAAARGYRSGADYWEDLDLYWRLSTLGRILVVPEVLTAYRHSGVSVRSRDSSDRLEQAAETMYEAASLFGAGQPYDHLLGRPHAADRRIRPRVYVARAWPSIWQGRRPRLLRRMLGGARLRLDAATISALAFVLWATASPRSLAALVRSLAIVRHARAARALDSAAVCEWRPRP